MLSLVLALVAVVLGAAYAFSRNLPPATLGLLALALVLVFVIGRRIEHGRDAAWEEAAAQWHATFQSEPDAEILRRFGQPTPWEEWARGGGAQCARAIEASAGQPPFALLHVRYPVRQPRGEESPEQWFDALVAAIPWPHPRATGLLRDLPADPDYSAASNGEFLFVWKKPRSPSEVPRASDLAPLLAEAQRLARATIPP